MYLKLQVGRVRVRVACPASAKAATDVAGLSRAHAAARMAPFDFAGFHGSPYVPISSHLASFASPFFYLQLSHAVTSLLLPSPFREKTVKPVPPLPPSVLGIG